MQSSNVPAGGSGCSIISASNSSYGMSFNLAGGGVFAMKWDTDGIRMCQSHVGTLFLWIKLSQWLGNWNRAMIPSESVRFLKAPLWFGLKKADETEVASLRRRLIPTFVGWAFFSSDH